MEEGVQHPDVLLVGMAGCKPCYISTGCCLPNAQSDPYTLLLHYLSPGASLTQPNITSLSARHLLPFTHTSLPFIRCPRLSVLLTF